MRRDLKLSHQSGLHCFKEGDSLRNLRESRQKARPPSPLLRDQGTFYNAANAREKKYKSAVVPG